MITVRTPATRPADDPLAGRVLVEGRCEVLLDGETVGTITAPEHAGDRYDSVRGQFVRSEHCFPGRWLFFDLSGVAYVDQVSERLNACVFDSLTVMLSRAETASDPEEDWRSVNTWHYLPVYVEANGERAYSLCEVYLGDDGRLTGWSSRRDSAPHGCDPGELLADLERMARAVQRWEPVEFDALTVGMRFEPLAGAPDRKTLLDDMLDR